MRAIVVDADADAAAPSSADASRVRRRGRSLVLEALGPVHYDRLHAALAVPAVAATWRSRGRTVPLYEWERFLAVGLALGFVAVDHDGALVGLVEVRDHDPLDRVAYVSAAACPAFVGSGRLVEAVVLAVDEAFAELDVVKLTFVLGESALAALGPERLSELVEIEGTLRSHTHLEGRRQDVTIGAIHRAGFGERVRSLPWLGALSPTPWRSVDHGGAGGGTAPADPADDIRRLEELLACPAGSLSAASPLHHDALDSLTVLELVAAIEGARGHPVAPELLRSIATVGDYLAWLGP